jgi:hypothetical protein
MYDNFNGRFPSVLIHYCILFAWGNPKYWGPLPGSLRQRVMLCLALFSFPLLGLLCLALLCFASGFAYGFA